MKNREKLEREFQANIIKKIKANLPDAIVLKNDPNYLVGFPDLTILGNKRYAVLECKQADNSSHRPLQDYYIHKINNMSYASFVHPENESEVLSDLIHILK